MENLILLFVIICVTLLIYFFGSHRNKFVFRVSSIVERFDNSEILLEGHVESGWIAVSQKLNFESKGTKNKFLVIITPHDK